MEADEAALKMKGSLEGVFHFHPDDAIYQDHFPGYPVVPGTLVIHAFLTALREAGIGQGVSSVENFKFREFLIPGRYRYMIEIRESRIYCSIIGNNKKLVTGVMNG